MLSLGDVVADRFELERVAGSGGMGTVYRARDRRTGETVALKVLLVGDGGEQVQRFAREAEVLAELRHPGIVRHVDHGTAADDQLYLAMEWLEGEDLARRLKRGRLTVDEALTLLKHVTAALGEVHERGVVHRDIKPSNLFLSGGRIDEVKILDFGIARRPEVAQAMTMTGATLGTPGYMAPEQARGESEVDARADVFSLGCVLFECLTGKAVFRGRHPLALLAKILLEEAQRVSEILTDVPPALDELVARMLAKHPSVRPRNAAGVMEQLERLAEGKGLAEPTVSEAHLVLTAAEQRLVCVVLIDASSSEALEGVTLVPLETPGRGGALKQLRAIVEGHGAAHTELASPSQGLPTGRAIIELELLADGSAVVMLAGSGAATDQAAQAARCALAMRTVLPEAPMALATGRAIVAGRWPVGEVIEHAVRLVRARVDPQPATLAAGDGDGAVAALPPSPRRGIRLDDVTAGLLDVRFDVGGDAAGLELRGEREIVEMTRTLLGKPSPCVGRERDLGFLVGVFEECVAEPVARVALVTAAAGVGKSRLRHEFLRRIHERGGQLELWMGRGDPMTAGAPYRMIAAPIRRAAGILDGEPLPLRRQKLHARVARNLPAAEVDRVLHFMGELVGVTFPDGNDPQLQAARLDPALMGDQIRRAWEDWLAAETAAQPVLIVLEDLHWGDLPTVRLIDVALRTLHDRPWMVLALARPEVRQRFERLWEERGVAEVRLIELTKKASERLVRSVLGDGVPEKTVERVVSQAGGNAFYLEELIRAVAAGKGEGLPETVLAMLQARFAGLSAPARRVLRAASIFGGVFWKRGLLALLGAADAGAIDARLAELCERELVIATGDVRIAGDERFAFCHVLVREAAYAMLTETDRSLGHRLAGDWLATAGRGETLALAEHFERGGDAVHAVSWYRRAAKEALEGYDLDGALARAGRAISCGAAGETLGELFLVLAETHRWRGELVEAETHALAALRALPRGSEAWYGAAAHVAEASGKLGRHETLVELGEELRDRGSDRLDHARLVAVVATGEQLLFSGRYYLADQLLDQHAGQQEDAAAPVPAMEGWFHRAASLRALFSGDLYSCAEHNFKAASAYEKTGDRRSACIHQIRYGHALGQIGAYQQAEAALREVLGIAANMGHLVAVLARHHLAAVLPRRNSLDEAHAMSAAVIEEWSTQGDRRLEAEARIELSAILAQMAGGGSGTSLDGAEREARRAVELSRTAPPTRIHALARLAAVLLQRGQAPEALAAAGEAVGLLNLLGGTDSGESFVRLAFAEALRGVGDEAQAKSAIAVARDRLIARAFKISNPIWRAFFLEQVPENARTQAIAREWLQA